MFSKLVLVKPLKTSEEHLPMMAYSHPSLINRLQEKRQISEIEAEELFDDTKRFLYLCAESSVPMSPPPAIDDCWHHFILFTRDYARFCTEFFGVFLHHRPRYLNDPPADGSHSTNSLVAAKRKFGKLSKNWDYPIEVTGNCDKCSNCERCSSTGDE